MEGLSYGVPQGSILSPLLFLIYVNDATSSVQQGRLVQYADDTTLYFNANSIEELEIPTFIGLNSTIQHFNELNLKTNSTKSNIIKFCLRNKDSDDCPTVIVDDTMIEEVYTTKFLGIHLDRGLTWDCHIDHVCSKLSSGLYVLRKLSEYCPTQVLITAYYGVIYPHLSYGLALWGGCANVNFSRIFILQKKAVRTIAKLHRRESCRQAFKNLKLLTLPCLYILQTCLFFMSKCDLVRGSDFHSYATRGRENYRTGRHRTVAYERLPTQKGVHFVNRLPNQIKNAPMPKALKARLKTTLIAQAFYSTDEFMAFDWETVQLAD